MNFLPTSITGAFLIEAPKIGDNRGFFSRFYCEAEMAKAGLVNEFAQINNSVAVRPGTMRGLHYQSAPNCETKFLRCINGSVYDVIVDLRPDSPTFCKWYGVELNADNRLSIYVPKGCAHGILSTSENAEILYLTDTPYAPVSERGVRFNDPFIGIVWPIPPVEVTEKDLSWPDVDPKSEDLRLLCGLVSS